MEAADELFEHPHRYPEVPVVFAGSRKFAEEWAYRFLGAAIGDYDRGESGSS